MFKIGFIGLGNMGLPLAKKLALNMPVFVFDKDQEKIKQLTDNNIIPATSIREVGDYADIVFTCLPSSKEVNEVILGELGLINFLKDGSLIVDSTSGDPDVTRDLSSKLSPYGIEIIDAPVSGGPKGANAGTIAFMVGSSDSQLERVYPVLSLITQNIFHSGELGSGHTIKAANNLLNLICRLATFEIISLLVNDGLEARKAVSIIQKSSGRNYATEVTMPDNILSGKLSQGFTTGLMDKDTSIALKRASKIKQEMPLGNVARTVLDGILERHGKTADMSVIALMYEELTGARIRPLKE